MITLGIIGIVAAMTIPNVIANYRKKEVEVKLKKAYSILQQALMLAEDEYGDYKNWTYNDVITSDYSFGEKYIFRYIKGGQYVYFRKFPLENLSGIGGSTLYDSNQYCVSGMCFWIKHGGGAVGDNPRPINWLLIMVDVSQGSKNRLGRDVFAFRYNHTKRANCPIIFPGGAYTSNCNYMNSIEDIKQYGCDKNNNSSYSGETCAALIYKNHWTIPDDYPW